MPMNTASPDRIPDYRPIRRRNGALCPGLYRKLADARAKGDALERARREQFGFMHNDQPDSQGGAYSARVSTPGKV